MLECVRVFSDLHIFASKMLLGGDGSFVAVSFADQPARDFHHQFVIAHDGNDFLLYQTVRLLS